MRLKHHIYTINGVSNKVDRNTINFSTPELGDIKCEDRAPIIQEHVVFC